jgi:hypothetical protein
VLRKRASPRTASATRSELRPKPALALQSTSLLAPGSYGGGAGVSRRFTDEERLAGATALHAHGQGGYFNERIRDERTAIRQAGGPARLPSAATPSPSSAIRASQGELRRAGQLGLLVRPAAPVRASTSRASWSRSLARRRDLKLCLDNENEPRLAVRHLN